MYSFICCPFYFIAVVISLAGTVFWIWMLIDMLQRKDDQFGESFGKDSKLIWVLLVLFTHLIGAVVYYFMVYKKFPRT